jgi:hypothetical protein
MSNLNDVCGSEASSVVFMKVQKICSNIEQGLSASKKEIGGFQGGLDVSSKVSAEKQKLYNNIEHVLGISKRERWG